MLPTVLTHTAKDWWEAERKRVNSWSQFKAVFLQSFLSEEHEVEVESRRQKVSESIRTFAYQNCALCLRLKPYVTEKAILQVTQEL